MIWFIEDYNEHQIYITDLWREWLLPKFRITMTVDEPYLYIYFNDRERGTGGDERVLQIDYRDVVDGYGGYVSNPASATALKTSIESMIVSGWENIPSGGDVLTAKADLLSHDGVSDTILPGGTNEYYLRRDNTETTGLKWVAGSQVVADGLTVNDSTTIDLTKAGATLSADVIKQMSITSDASGLKLSGDATSPGNYQEYGTNSSGTKGWYPTRTRLLGQNNGTISHTGTAAETKIFSITVPANTVGNNDIIEVFALARRTTGAGSIQIDVYFNETDDLTTPQRVGQVVTAANQTILTRNQHKWLNTNNSTVGTPATGMSSVFGGTPNTTTIDNTSQFYIVFSCTLGTGTDTGTIYFVGATLHKSA